MCSSNYPGDACDASSTADGLYGSNEACTVTFGHDVRLSVHLFETESGYDQLTVDGTIYDGTSGPNGLTTSGLSWSSDDSFGRSGFKICAACEFEHQCPPSPPLPSNALPREQWRDQMLCRENCHGWGVVYSSDGECDDGGPGSHYDDCEFGTDCKGASLA